MKPKPVKTVLLYNRGHMGSIIVLNKLLKMKCYDVTAIVRVKNVNFSAKGYKKLRKNLDKTGFLFAFMLFFQFLIQGLAFLISFMLPFLKNRSLTSTEIAKKYKLAVHDSDNINSEETINFLKEQNPEILISAYFPQILKVQALAVPRKGVLNIHPGRIPEYKGAMAYFWAVKNNAKTAGVSVHWMDEGIDTGPLIARKSFKIKQKTTQDKVLIKTALVGSALLKRVGKKLARGTEPKTININKEKKAYYPLPGKKAYKEYSLTHSFLSFGAIFRAILGKY